MWQSTACAKLSPDACTQCTWAHAPGVRLQAALFGAAAAGLYVYLMSSMALSQKAGFYKYHRYLGLATYIAGLVAGARGSRHLVCALRPPTCSTACICGKAVAAALRVSPIRTCVR